MILTAIGAGLAWANLFLVATAGVSPEESGLAAGIVNTSQQLGAALGLAVLASIAAARTNDVRRTNPGLPAHAALVEGFQRGFVVGGVVVAVGALVALLGVPQRERRGGAPPSEGDTPLLQAEEAEVSGGAI